MKSLTAVVLALSLSVGVHNAQAADGPVVYYGAGTQICAKYIEYFHVSEINDMFTSWAQGWIAGWNAASIVHDKTYREVEASQAEDLHHYMY
jgi:hypothetical protein